VNETAIATSASAMHVAPNMNRRNFVLGGLLLVTLAVSAWTLMSGPDESVVEPVARQAKGVASGAKVNAVARRPVPDGPPAVMGPVDRPQAPAAIVNLFSAYSYQAPVAVPSAAVVSKPHAPPLPFTYTGRLEMTDGTTYLLLQGDTPLSVTPGSAVGDFTLVEAGNDRLVFQHEPTGERVVLSTAKGPN